MEALGAYFAALRGVRSRADLAAEVGLSEMSILRIEEKGQEPKAETLAALVRALHAHWGDVGVLLSNPKARAEDGRRLAEEWMARLEQAQDSSSRHVVLEQIIADLEANPQKLDRLIGYGARLLDEDQDHGAR